MVEDTTTDGRRIGQLLSSELTGHTGGVLGGVSVVDARPDVEPTAQGAEAYAVEYDGERVGTVALLPDSAVMDLVDPVPAVGQSARDGLRVTGEDRTRLVIERGAAVKAATDVLVAALQRRQR